jgi:hypothetical protein
MELTDTQKESVAAWFAGGASLDEIQKRLKSEFGIHMTYLDVRLMVAELPQPEEKVADRAGDAGEAGEAVGEAKTPRTPKTPRTELQDKGREFADGPDSRKGNGEDLADEYEGEEIPEDGEATDSTEAQTVSAPTVTIDALMLPGTLASGDVTFSDGKAGKWYLDQMGRLGIGNLPEGYRPSPTDAALFQQQLMGLLQSKGLC